MEVLTDGWGLGGRFFTPWFLQNIPTWQLWYLAAVAGLLLSMIGVAFGALWVRWRATGLLVGFGVLALTLVAVAWLLTVGGAWGSWGDYLAGHAPAVSATWLVPVALAFGACGYLVLRRATPRA